MKWDENEGDTSYYFNPKIVNRWLKNTDICIAEGVWILIKFQTTISLIVEVPLNVSFFYVCHQFGEKSIENEEDSRKWTI